MNIIRADKLTKQYGDFKAVNGISFTVEKGELLGFLGVNGAGKYAFHPYPAHLGQCRDMWL